MPLLSGDRTSKLKIMQIGITIQLNYNSQVAPVLEAIASEHAGPVDVVKLNTDENPATTQRYQVLAIPTVAVFSGGQVVKQVLGARSRSALLRDFADVL